MFRTRAMRLKISFILAVIFLFTCFGINPSNALETCDGYVFDENSWCLEKYGDAFSKGVMIAIASEPDDRSTYLPALYIGCESKKIFVQLYNSEANVLASGNTGYIKFDSGTTSTFKYSAFTPGDGLLFVDPVSFITKFNLVKRKIDLKIPSNYYGNWVVSYRKANYNSYKKFLSKQGCKI